MAVVWLSFTSLLTISGWVDLGYDFHIASKLTGVITIHASQKMISMKKKKKRESIAVFYFNLYFYGVHVTSDHISVSETPSYNYTWPQRGAAWCSTSTFLGRKSTMFILVKNKKSLLNCTLFFLIVFTSSFHSGLDLFSSYLPSLNKMEVSWEQVLWVFSTSAEKWW